MNRVAFVLFACVLAIPASSDAVIPRTLAASGGLELADGTRARVSRSTLWGAGPRSRQAAMAKWIAEFGGAWRVLWDRDTAVPLRVFGSGVTAPGVIASDKLAERFAQRVLADHIELFAPGASASDFVLAANDFHRDLRIVGFVQTARGLPVVGGQLAFFFKNDRLIAVGSEALPNVTVHAGPITREHVRHIATAWMRQDGVDVVARADVEGPMVLPIVRSGVVRYETVLKGVVERVGAPGQWSVYVDADSGLAVARADDLRFATGRVLYNTPVRRPDGDRSDFPAATVELTIAGEGVVNTDGNGYVSWASASPAQVTLSVTGLRAAVASDEGDLATTELVLNPDGQVVWSESDSELLDAQLTSYIHSLIVKKYTRTFAGNLAWINEQMPVRVNINEACNAFSDGNSINFFRASDDCENSARLPDVIYHEFGHVLHTKSLVEGAGQFDGAFSEGLSDYLAVTMNDDSGMGRGFFYGDEPLREVDPVGMEHRWPEDVGEVHYTGLIFAGAMWDLRQALVEKMGYEAGVQYANELFYDAVRMSSDIPSSYVSVLMSDDDDGNLENGTPNVCLINREFGRHGLRGVSAIVSGLGAEVPGEAPFSVSLEVAGLFDQCPGDAVESATMSYGPAGTDEPETVVMQAMTDSLFTGEIPPPADNGVVEYWFTVEFADGTSRIYPENPADRRYQFYSGETVELYCTDFESDPFAAGWESGLETGTDTEGANDWQWGAPTGASGSGDPSSAYSGESVLGNDLGALDFNGIYQSNKQNYVLSPEIDIARYSDVRLQYRRWLTVEDGFFDQARIKVGDEVAWENFNSDQGNSSTIHHRDTEWRFHDVALTPHIRDNPIRVKFELETDAGLEFGGWTIDDVCIVADASSICGDGKLTGGEQCDDGDGNDDEAKDACRENCRLAACGDGVRDSGEQCDDGGFDNGDGCDEECRVEGKSDCGLVVVGRRRGGGLLYFTTLIAIVFSTMRRRRRRCA